MQVRTASVAGQFYPSRHAECVAQIKECMPDTPIRAELPEKIAGAVVPHAGWAFSGDLSAMAMEAVRRQNIEVDTFVLYGASHRRAGLCPSVYYMGAWETPLGLVEVDEELAEMICQSENADKDNRSHSGEHSLEVQVPFIQYLFPKAKIVPILTGPSDISRDLGADIGRIMASLPGHKRIVCLASTDLTHYGPRYGFTPQGTGPEAIRWAKEINDMELIRAAVEMNSIAVLQSAEAHWNACGAGAVAALIETVRVLGREKGILLGHTHSSEVMQEKYGQPSQESVGYAAIVY